MTFHMLHTGCLTLCTFASLLIGRSLLPECITATQSPAADIKTVMNGPLARLSVIGSWGTGALGDL